ncbi:MAG: thioredoxin family protein [Planctomycetota bacterium]
MAMLDPAYLKEKFEAGLPYDQYVATGKPGEQDNWKTFDSRVTLTEAQRSLIGGFTREVNCLMVSGTWCGDCVQQVPMLAHIERMNPKFRLRLVDRDKHMDLAEELMICGGTRVPAGLLLNEDFDVLTMVGDRTLSRYRAMAARNLGPSCPVPGAPVPDDEIAATVQDWVDEVERAHLICRTSTKLRGRHGD